MFAFNTRVRNGRGSSNTPLGGGWIHHSRHSSSLEAKFEEKLGVSKPNSTRKKRKRTWADIPQSETLQEGYIVGQAGMGAHSVVSRCFIKDCIRKLFWKQSFLRKRATPERVSEGALSNLPSWSRFPEYLHLGVARLILTAERDKVMFGFDLGL